MEKKGDLKQRENLYRLIINQLNHDGLTELASNLATATNTAPSAPSDSLLRIFAQGLSIEMEAKEMNPVKIGIDLEYETEAARMALEPANYEKCVTISHNAQCRTGAFSNDGQFIATGSKDACIKVMDTDEYKMAQLDLEIPKVICTLQEHKEAITCLEFHPKEYIVVSGSKDCTVKLFDFGRSAKSAIKTITELSEISCIALHPSGEFILVGTQDPVFKLYDLNSSEIFTSASFRLQHKSQITMIKYSPDEKMFATCSKDGDIKLWDTVSNRCVNSFSSAHEGKEVCSIQFSRNSKYLLSSASCNSPVKLWELSMARALIAYTADGVTGSRHKDSQAVFNHTEDFVLFPNEVTSHLCCWNSRNAVSQQLLSLGHINSVGFVTHSPCSPAFITCSDDLTAKYWYSTLESQL